MGSQPTLTLTACSLALAALAALHRRPPERRSPRATALVWVIALALRALVAFIVSLGVFLVAPSAAAFETVSHWCDELALPLTGTSLTVSGHPLADILLLAPVLVMLALGLRETAFIAWGARALNRAIDRAAVERRPDGTWLIADGDIIIAAAGFVRPRVFVSTGALELLDEDELVEGVDHEHAAAQRRHALILVVADLLAAFGRVLPGTAACRAQVMLHLDRDAAAQAHAPRAAHRPAERPLARRVRAVPQHVPDLAGVLAIAMAALAVLGATAVVTTAHAGVQRAQGAATTSHCL